MLLSDDEILYRVGTHVGGVSPSYPLDRSDWINFARAIESEILAKLGAMELPEPVVIDKHESGYEIRGYKKDQLHQAYAQGAAAQLSSKAVGWFVKEHGDVVDLEWNSEKPKYEGDWKPLYTRREA